MYNAHGTVSGRHSVILKCFHLWGNTVGIICEQEESGRGDKSNKPLLTPSMKMGFELCSTIYSVQLKTLDAEVVI
jgi:hypothetical protein